MTKNQNQTPVEAPIDFRCPHCAISEFLNSWHDRHPNSTGDEALRGLLEVIADIVQSFPTRQERLDTALLVTERLLGDMAEILSGTYKDGVHLSSSTIQ